MPNTTRTVRRDSLERVVSEILDIPFRGRKGKAYEIVNAILKTITDGLWRGEKVHIEGLGIFKVRTRPPKNYWVTLLRNRWKPGLKKSLVQVGPRKYVHFVPYKSIVKALNDN